MKLICLRIGLEDKLISLELFVGHELREVTIVAVCEIFIFVKKLEALEQFNYAVYFVLSSDTGVLLQNDPNGCLLEVVEHHCTYPALDLVPFDF